MKMDAILDAIAKANGSAKAVEALGGALERGMPPDDPPEPDTDPNGPPDDIPPDETGEAPEFFDGLPIIAMENTPDVFPADPESNVDEDEILEFLFM